VADHTAATGAGPAGTAGAGTRGSARGTMPGSDSSVQTTGQTRAVPPSRAVIAGGPRWKLRNWRLRTKLVAVLLIPIVTALALGGLRVRDELARAAAFEESATSVDAAVQMVSLAHELQAERNLVVAFVAANRQGDAGPMQGQIQRTNASLAKMRETVGSDADRYPISTRIAQRLTSIAALREAAQSSAYPDIALFTGYTSLLEAVLEGGAEFSSGISDSELGRLAYASVAVVTAKEYDARQTAVLTIAAMRNFFPAGLTDQSQIAQAGYEAAFRNFLSNATPAEAQFFADTVSGPEIDDRERIETTSLNRAAKDEPLDIDLNRLTSDSRHSSDTLHRVELSLLDQLRQSAADRADTARENAYRDAGIVLIALLLGLLFTFIVARSLLKPLRVLRRDALDVANRRLPETVQRILDDPDPVAASRNAVDPVPVFTREETGQLARSFDAVHDQAVRMATEQAMLRDNINSIFVNLSRRSQTLVERQLSLIDRLEQDEQDPDQLASLFELDHLATRMRRNSESLLVLSGHGLSRQLNRPVPAAEVVGAAVSEVEHYARVEVLSSPDVTVQGRAVSDLVHLIAELLDNATSFSEPEKKVSVRMAFTRKKELAIQITDAGVGMSEEDIEATNLRLAEPPDLDVAVTRRMGLYVVARLAKRHNIIVRLRDNEDIEGGLVARVTVPATLVQRSGAAPQSMTTTSLTDSSVESSFPAQPAARASSIASAFTGSIPRLRPDGTVADESQVDRTPDDLAGYPPFQPVGYAGFNAAPAPGWDDVEVYDGDALIAHEDDEFENGHPYHGENGNNGQSSSVALFGSPLPEPEYSGDTGYHSLSGEVSSPPAMELDAPTERLPIYEAVLSQWFEAADTGSMPAPDAPAVNGASNDGDEEDGVMAGPPDTDANWQSPGDEGWLAAQALMSSREEKITSAGLPKRVPKAQLVPGSATPRHELAEPEAPTAAGVAVPAVATATAMPMPPRTADAVRGRMSSYQQGVRRGRHALVDTTDDDQPIEDESRQDEEQE